MKKEIKEIKEIIKFIKQLIKEFEIIKIEINYIKEYFKF